MISKVHISSLLLTCIILSVIASPSLSIDNYKPIVVATTSVLASIVKDLAGDKVIVEVIASPAICPAHYDVKPSDIEKVREATLILRHGFEPWVEDLVKASGSRASIITIKGPWNTPELLRKKYITIAGILEKHLGINVSRDLERCLRVINETSEWLRRFAENNGFQDTPVVSMLWQKNFIEFLGFKVIAVFGPPEKITPRQYEEIIGNATRSHAILVIDNLQSGTELGRKIADEIGGVEVALTNFPWTAPGLNNMTEVMKYNAQLLAQALYFAKLKNVTLSTNILYSEGSELQNKATVWKYAFIASVIVNIILALGIALLIKKLKER